MKKPWSITTTLRNPDRLRSFLMTLDKMNGEEWDRQAQEKYQIYLIQDRNYGYGSSQFYNGLSQEQVDLINDQTKELSFDFAKEVFYAKNYEDPSMRGRQSFNPLKKIGLATVDDGKIKITDLGKDFLKEDFDYGDIFLRSFLKWQIPNPASNDYKREDGYDIKPFIGVLHLINAVNIKSRENGEKEKGISKQEFALFCPTLINYNQVEPYAQKIIELREKQAGKTKREKNEIFKDFQNRFLKDFLIDPSDTELSGLISNLKDYGDNAIRYFRLTRFLYIRGGGFYIDLEPRRIVEITNLLAFDSAKSKDFDDEAEYLDYISDINKPELPWETPEEYKKIIKILIDDIREYQKELNIELIQEENYLSFGKDELKDYISVLRKQRRSLQEKENHVNSQDINQVSEYIETLENIFNLEDKPIVLEKMSSLGLNALNDAIKIQPNYPVGDDNEPTFTAPANTPDIECFYESFNAICEVTMLKSRDQWYNEGQPVMRHLRDFESVNSDKESYCLFIAPSIHRDTLNTFWMAVKYEYEGSPQKIVPLTINNFIKVLKTLIQIKNKQKAFKHTDIKSLYDSILSDVVNHSDSQQWLISIDKLIENWESELLQVS